MTYEERVTREIGTLKGQCHRTRIFSAHVKLEKLQDARAVTLPL